MKKIISTLIVTAAALIIFSCSKTEDIYTMANFDQGIQVQTENTDEFYGFLLEFNNNSKDIAVLRRSADMMMRIDKEKTHAHLKQRAENNPDDKIALYLYGRIMEDKEKSIETGRRIVGMDKDWEFGYRLITNVYVFDLYLTDVENTDEIVEKMIADRKYFEDYRNLGTADGNHNLVYFKYLLYTSDPGLAEFVDNAEKNSEPWLTDELIAEAWTSEGNYEKAEEYFFRFMKKNYPEMNDMELSKYAIMSIFYKLQELKKMDEAHDFIMMDSKDLEEKDRYALSGKLYAKQKNTGKALYNLNIAANMGYDDIFSFDNDPDFVEIRTEKKWNEIETRIKANYRANTGKRKQKALSEKFSKPAPASTFKDSQNNDLTLESLKGQVVILDFWATWCGPCRMAMPVLSDFAEKNKGKVKIYSVNVWERDPEAAKKFFEENGYKMELAYGEENSHEKFGFQGIPYICVIDKDGNIRYSESGFSHGLGEKLAWWVEDLNSGN